MRIFFVFIFMFLVNINAQAANNAEKYYSPQNEVNLKNPLFLKPNEQPILVETESRKDFFIKLNELQSKGYLALGISEFSDYKISDNVVLSQAKKIKATAVLMLREVANRHLSYEHGEDLNQLNWAYRYTVIYFVKEQSIQNLLIGISMDELDLEEKISFQRNIGVIVHTVYENGRAYLANILKDDVITHINQRVVVSPSDFNKIRDEEMKKSKTLNFSILRLVNGQLKELTIPINFD